MLEEVINTFGSEGINAVVDATGKRFQESQREKAAGSPAWWRVSALNFSLLLYFLKGLTSHYFSDIFSPVQFLFLTLQLTFIFFPFVR